MIRETSVRLRHVEEARIDADAEQVVAFTCPGDRLDPASARMLERLGVAPGELEASGLLPARVHQVATGPLLGAGRPRRVVLVGLDPEAGAVAAVRDAATIAGRHAEGDGPIAVALPTLAARRPGATEALVEGLILGRHRFDRYRSGVAPRPSALDLLVAADVAEDALIAEARRGAIVADAANWARDLATTAPADKTPEVLAEELRAVVAAAGGSVRIWSERELEAAGFRGVLAVASGSPARPAMVEIELRGDASRDAHVALAGKGVTFDSGGLDLKAVESMYTMKHDMGGAAAVAAAVYAAGRLALPVNLHVALPLVENMPSGTALRPGDVIEHWNGMTSEVVSPDAEGRLILADAISYLTTRAPRSLLAVSTLTGTTAVGADLWGVFSDAHDLAGDLVEAGRRAGEPGWALPLWRPYRSYLDSAVADLRNTGERLTYSVAGIVASLFLAEFVPPSLPWAHIDIAATVARTRLTANAAWPAGATGSPARALVRWLEATGAAA
ncbi:MAG TPA: leucyl aminopeptidase family protein [Baekduia sp.]|uniref:leucyl aminopeptidase family protein n=1 Tax=Baekduia sp. TaxID=2600305 RepID=UPI002D796F15|nr:leucyl aminopeptidase family protein [Baekduia sp.]HET6505372.1 leucyl aminopeptidase family protein [Baekduia sp.]